MTNTLVVVIKTLMKLLTYFKMSVGSLLLVRDLVPLFIFWWLLPGTLKNSYACHIVTLSQSVALVPTIISSKSS